MTRIAIYARYSSELQKESSIEDQLRVCREYAEKQGWEIVQTYADKEESGASLLRPGIQSLFEDAQSGSFELVLSEALDRISRDQADIAIVYRDMTFQASSTMNSMLVGLFGTARNSSKTRKRESALPATILKASGSFTMCLNCAL